MLIRATDNLINHDQHPRFCMLHTFHITVDCHPESLIESIFSPTERNANILWIGGFGAEEEYVRSGVLGNDVEVLQDNRSDTIRVWIHDKVGIDVDRGGSLQAQSASTVIRGDLRADDNTRQIGVSLKIFCLIF
jgi:hypothetical protein